MAHNSLRDQIFALFENYKAGDSDALIQIIEIERPSMFDYAFRMSGQRDGALKVFDEVAAAMREEEATQFQNYEQFRVKLFATVRSFCSHIWNADTSQLVNEGYEGFEFERSEASLTDTQIRRVETSLGALPVWEKEPLILKLRCGFPPAVIAEIMSSSPKAVSEGMNNAYIRIAQVCQMEPEQIDKAIIGIPDHPLTGGTMHSTAALSQIMGDIENSRSRFGLSKTVMGLLIIAGALALGYYIAHNYQEMIP